MKLYQFFASPFPTRVRLMLYAKGIPFEIVEPPGFGSSKLPKGDYLKLNPLGRVPDRMRMGFCIGRRRLREQREMRPNLSIRSEEPEPIHHS
jgi:hypothetical protein